MRRVMVGTVGGGGKGYAVGVFTSKEAHLNYFVFLGYFHYCP